MIDLLLNRKQPGKIQNITLDAVLNENHEYSSEVTQFPIENGAIISDHIRSTPERITLTGFITNSPIPSSPFNVESYTAMYKNSAIGQMSKNKSITRTMGAFEELLRIAGHPNTSNPSSISPQRTLIDVVTGLKVYTDMVLTSLSIPRDSSTGDALVFTATFQKVYTVSSLSVPITKVADKVEHKTSTQVPSKTSAGKQSTKAAAPKTSTAAKLLDKVFKGVW